MYGIRKITASIAMSAALLAAPAVNAAEVTEVAPLASLTSKAVTLGTLLANPLLPALLVSSLQQNITASYCRLRSDKPLFWVVPSGGISESVPVLPCSEGIAQFTLNHPGSVRNSDGSVRLLAAEGRPDEMFAVFDQNDGYAAFALSAASARRALEATRAARRAKVTVGGDPLVRMSLDETAFAARAAAAAFAGTNHMEVASQVAGLDAGVSIDNSGLSVTADVKPRAGVTVEELCVRLEKSLGASLKSFGSAEGIRSDCRFTPSIGSVKVRLVLPADEMKKVGKIFNAVVVQAMSSEQPAGKKSAK